MPSLGSTCFPRCSSLLCSFGYSLFLHALFKKHLDFFVHVHLGQLLLQSSLFLALSSSDLPSLSKKTSFIVSVSPLYGAYTDTMLNSCPAITSFSLIRLSDGLDTSTTFSLNSAWGQDDPTPILLLFSPQ